MNEINLKKCPFCGGDAEMCFGSDNIYGGYWYVRCKDCFGRGSSSYESLNTLSENIKYFAIQGAWNGAINSWNRRVINE